MNNKLIYIALGLVGLYIAYRIYKSSKEPSNMVPIAQSKDVPSDFNPEYASSIEDYYSMMEEEESATGQSSI